MSESVFFAMRRNRANQRKVLLKSALLMPGKASDKQKRIRMKLLLPLSGEKTVGMPDWLIDAFEFVSKSGDTVKPDLELVGNFDVEFDADNLFGDKVVKVPKVDMKGFEVYGVGGGEAPDVVCSLTMYAAFSTSLCRWAGQMVGEPFYARFTARAPELASQELVLVSAPPVEEDEGEEEDEG